MFPIDRRTFIAAGTGGAVAALSSTAIASANKANSKVVLAVMGVHSRGAYLAKLFSKIPGVEIRYVCDCDERQIGTGVEAVPTTGRSAPLKTTGDFRDALDDPAVDALVCAAPNHWHAAATIAACQADKHVYVEKPCSHTAEEGERMIAAAEKSNRVVQVGMQRRSGALYQEMVQRIQDGVIGDVLLAKSWYFRNRPSIGRAEPESPPSELDYDMWQGPVTEQPYRSNILPYNWHNFWQWGNGEVGNNGVHTIDICRWALGVDFPDQVDVYGAKLRYDDDSETPDTMNASFRCGNKLITWEGVSWSDPYKAASQVGIELRGVEGTLAINDNGYTVYDINRQPIEEKKASRGDDEHCENFIDCIRNGSTPNASITEGHRSALFCHLANIAHRSNETLKIDPSNGHLLESTSAADELWGCDYRAQWMPSA